MSFSNDIPSLENQLPLSVEFPPTYERYQQEFQFLYQRIANSVNSKEGGLYVPQEKTTGMRYFTENDPQTFKNVYRMVVDFGTLPNTGTTSVAHNIPNWDSNFLLTRAYGAATDTVGLSSVPIPNEGIFLEINNSDVTITTSNDFSRYTETTIVIEYTKG